jgi:hypothetical protein
MPYGKACYYWSRGWYAEKMQAYRIAGAMWGKDIDAEIEQESEYHDTSYDELSTFFGVDLG